MNQEWLTDAFRLIQTALLHPYVNVAVKILANMSRKVACVIGDKWIDPHGCVLGIRYLISEEGGVDIVLPLTHWRGCLQTINQFISAIHSHYFSLCLHLPSTCTLPAPLPHHPLFSLTYSPFSSLFLSLSQTRVCSPSIIFNMPFPEHRCMPESQTKRLWYEPGCVGRASYLHVGFNSFSVRRG